MSSFVRVVRRWPNAGFGSYLLTTIDTVAAILEAGLIPVVDYRHRKSMQLYRTYDGENVWDTFFHQQHSVAEAVECPELTVDFGKRQKVPLLTYYESRSTFQSFLQPREAVDHFATQRINYRIGKGIEYDCIYFRGTDKKNERRPVPFVPQQSHRVLPSRSSATECPAMTYPSDYPELPPYPFVPPFDPPGSESPYYPEEEDDGPIILTPPPLPPLPVWPDDYPPGSPDPGPRPPWWPDDFPWPPPPEEPVVIESPPPIHVWPRLPPDHPYHVPPGYSAPDDLPPGHPGEAYPGMPDYPVVHPGDWGDGWPSYPGILAD